MSSWCWKRRVDDAHVAELAANGVSCLVSDADSIDLAATVATLRRELGIETLLLEGCEDAERIITAGSGLKGKVALSLLGGEPLEAGAVHLRYAIGVPD